MRRPRRLRDPGLFGWKAFGPLRDATIAGFRAVTTSRPIQARIGRTHIMTTIQKDGDSTKATGTGKTMTTAMTTGARTLSF